MSENRPADNPEEQKNVERRKEKQARRRGRREERSTVDWEPRTRLGRLVKSGHLSTMGAALRSGLPLREPEIVDILLPDLEDEVLDVNMVQRMTDSGRRVKFAITAVVGDKDGYVGLGQAKGKEVGPSIRKAIDNAKLNIIEIKRGAGSWESGPGAPPTSVPFRIDGKCSSVRVSIKPAPRGTGLATGAVARHILRLAGIKDAWAFTNGQTQTTTNYSKAVFDALKKLGTTRTLSRMEEKAGIISGPIGGYGPVSASGEELDEEEVTA
ncbi:MAG: 30S ribosomal protein S5 [Euryarchaeota archaeon]|nr:30S ribosomal protein S5 [Euryarchaeota archaeon]